MRVTQTIAAIFILVFVYTGISKLLSMDVFIKVLHQSVLLSGVSNWVAWVLPFVELVIAALLVFPETRKAGLWLSLGLMILFTAYIGWMLVYEPKLPCSCGGVIRYMSWRVHLVFNTVLIVLAITGIRTIPKGVSRKPVKE